MGENSKAFLDALKGMDVTMREDIANDMPWVYDNARTPAASFRVARKTGKRYISCANAVKWALKAIGIPSASLSWWGDMGVIHWSSANAEKEAKKFFNIIKIGNKTQKQCIAEGLILPGDVLMFNDYRHTNAVYSKTKSFDAGHAYCNGEAFTKWIGKMVCANDKVSYIFRLKELYYRVQIEADSKKATAYATAKKAKEALGLETFTEYMSDKRWHVFCGSFDSEDNALKRRDVVRSVYPKAFVKEVLA